jgi:hypothetical protein
LWAGRFRLATSGVQVFFQGSGSQIWSIPIAPAAPGMFTLDSTGAGPAAVLNQDNSVNGPTQPAARGSVIQIFATGIPVRGAVTGSITPAAAPGSTDPVSVTIGGVTASILYAGPAPGEIAGLVQVNAVVQTLPRPGRRSRASSVSVRRRALSSRSSMPAREKRQLRCNKRALSLQVPPTSSPICFLTSAGASITMAKRKRNVQGGNT